MQQVIKKAVKKVIGLFHEDFEVWYWDKAYFKSLKRRPPELMWEPCRRGPELRQDAASIQFDGKLYLVAGFRDADTVLDAVDVFDLHRCTWEGRFQIPAGMGQTHLGIACDEQGYAYIAGGQYGSQCSPSTPRCFVLHVPSRQWQELPSLPEARYAPIVQLWQGRLHVAGGSKRDRCTPAADHWSIAVKDGQAKKNWRQEPPLPRGGPHRASAVIHNKLYVFGGQEGDFVPTPGDAKCTCRDPEKAEVIYGDTYMLEPGQAQWKRMTDMPVKVSHTEFSILVMGQNAVLLGGIHDRDPVSKRMLLTDAVQIYDTATDTWNMAGRLPYRIKSTVAAYANGWLYMTTGQRDRNIDDPTPGWYDDRVWRAKFSVRQK